MMNGVEQRNGGEGMAREGWIDIERRIEVMCEGLEIEDTGSKGEISK